MVKGRGKTARSAAGAKATPRGGAPRIVASSPPKSPPAPPEPEAFEDDLETCDNCGNDFPRDDMIPGEEGGAYCETCFQTEGVLDEDDEDDGEDGDDDGGDPSGDPSDGGATFSYSGAGARGYDGDFGDDIGDDIGDVGGDMEDDMQDIYDDAEEDLGGDDFLEDDDDFDGDYSDDFDDDLDGDGRGYRDGRYGGRRGRGYRNGRYGGQRGGRFRRYLANRRARGRGGRRQPLFNAGRGNGHSGWVADMPDSIKRATIGEGWKHFEALMREAEQAFVGMMHQAQGGGR